LSPKNLSRAIRKKEKLFFIFIKKQQPFSRSYRHGRGNFFTNTLNPEKADYVTDPLAQSLLRLAQAFSKPTTKDPESKPPEKL